MARVGFVERPTSTSRSSSLKWIYERGWVQEDDDGKGRFIDYFPSKISKELWRYMLLRDKITEDYPLEFKSLKEWCFTAIKGFSATQLRTQNALGQQIRRGLLLPEAQYGDLLFHNLLESSSSRFTILSEFHISGLNPGRVDFLIEKFGWIIELLQGGDKFTKHIERFEPGGSYFESAKGKEYALLNFCPKGQNKARQLGAVETQKLLPARGSIIDYTRTKTLTIAPEHEHIFHVEFEDDGQGPIPYAILDSGLEVLTYGY
ncbi:MAG: hypothetical protein Q9187_001896 [Circinaria calcarea]